MKYVAQRMCIVALVLHNACCGSSLIGQQALAHSQSPTRLSQEAQWSSAQNQWRRDPIDITSQKDTVSPDVRARRNAYWTRPAANQLIRNGGSGLAAIDTRVPEVSQVKGLPNIWVVARFEGLHVYTIDTDQNLIYTEVNFRISSLIREPHGLQFAQGSLLDVMDVGGSLRTAKGETKSAHLSPELYAVQPGHSYILQLLYNEQFETFTIRDQWDVTSGTVEPDTMVDVARVALGKSLLNGMSVSHAVSYLQSVLPNE